MIVAAFIGALFLLFLYYVWTDLGELIEAELADEVGAGRALQPRTLPSYGLTARATAGTNNTQP